MNHRWLPYAEGEAAWNMAVDEAILESHLQEHSPTTLRFYGWTPPTVSIGYAQGIDAQVVNNIIARGFSVVRRPTGGRAVLHQGDLTYSYVGGALLAPGVSKSYLQICQGLIEGLKLLGVDAEIGRGKGGYNRFQDCFQSTTSADLQVNGLKIVGSAQLRRKHAVLQHGSILLNQDQMLMPQLLSSSTSTQPAASKFDPDPTSPDPTSPDPTSPDPTSPDPTNPDPTNPAPTNPDSSTPVPSNPRHCNVFDLIGVHPMAEIEQAFFEGFCHTSGQRFERGTLTDFEIELAKTLLPKYLIAG